jgi:cytochrome c
MTLRTAIACLVLIAWLSPAHSQPSSTTSSAASKATGAKMSVWSGVYTTAQAKRGEKVHSTGCAMCHGPRLDGAGQPDMPASPGIAGSMLLFKWKGQTVAALFEYVWTKMPTDNPGTLTAQDSIDSIAHMFAVSEMPPGDKELLPDVAALADIVIADKPK